MKRSLMIQLLVDTLEPSIPDILERFIAAERALDCCENAGMEPPYNNGDVFERNEWESEDNECGAV